MAIDWSKYGIKEQKESPTVNKQPNLSVDFTKYGVKEQNISQKVNKQPEQPKLSVDFTKYGVGDKVPSPEKVQEIKTSFQEGMPKVVDYFKGVGDSLRQGVERRKTQPKVVVPSPSNPVSVEDIKSGKVVTAPSGELTAYSPSNKKVESPRTINEELAYREAERDKILPDNAIGQAMQNMYREVDHFLLNNPVGSFITRLGQSGASALGQSPFHETPETGSKVADTVADVGGSIGSLFVNPGGVTSVSPGQASIVGQIYNNPAVQRLSQSAASRVSNPTASRAVNEAVREGITGAVEGGAMTLARGGSEQEALQNALLGGVLGGSTGAALPLAEQGVRRLMSPRQSTRATETPIQANVSPDKVNAPLQPEASLRNAPNADDGIPKGVFPEPEPAPSVNQSWFEKMFGTNPIGITAGVRNAGRNKLTTEGQIVDSPLRNEAKNLAETAAAGAKRAYYEFVDMNAPIKQISRKAYDQSIDARRGNQIANVIVSDKFVNPQGQVMGQGLKEIVQKAGRGNYNAFTDYLVARHALTRMGRGEKVYSDHLKMTPDKVSERIRTMEQRYPGFREIGQEWDNYYKNVRNIYGVEEGLISRELADYLESHNPTYVPMRRQFLRSEKIKGASFTGAKPAFSGQKAPIQRVSPTGSARQIVDPVRSTIEQTGSWVNAAMRNRVMKSVVDKVMQDPDNMKGIAEIVQPPKGQHNLKEILMRDGQEEFLESLQSDFDKLFSKTRLDQDNVVRAMVNGEPVYVRVHDPEALKALLGMGAEQANVALNVMTNLSNLVKQGATGALAPLFAAKGATMDVAQALIQSENPLQHAGYLIGSVVSSVADALNIPGLRNMAQSYYRAGGGYSAALRGERNLRRSVSDIRQDPLLNPRTIARGVGKAIASPYKLSLKVSDIAENMNRIAAYNYKMRQLGGEPTADNVREAMNYAREITTNWSRRGRQSQTLESLIPYNNAAVQGMYRFAKSWAKNPVKTASMVGLSIVAPKMYEYMQFGDDPDYKLLTARERYRNLIVSKNEDGTFVKIPMSPEYNGLGALVVDSLRAFKDGDPEAFKGALDAMMQSYSPPIVEGAAQGLTQGGGIDQSLWGMANATAVGPLLGAMGNQSFTGAPIVPMRMEDRSPQYQYDERTTEVAKWLGERTGWSPMKIDYVIRSYGGDPARLLLPLTSDYGGGTARNTLLRNFIVDPTFSNTLSDDFYRAKDMLNQAYRDYNEVGAPLPEWYNDEARKVLSSQANGSVSKMLSQLNQFKRDINADKSLSAKEKSQRTREVQERINDIYIEVNSRMRELGIPVLNR